MSETVAGVIMGIGAPNDSRHGKTMCAILLTEQRGFIRVYPIPASEQFPLWGRISAEIEKGSDSRQESFRLLRWDVEGSVARNDQRNLLDDVCLKSGADDPIDYQNERRRSIAMVKLDWGNFDYSMSTRKPKGIPCDDGEFSWIVTQGQHWQKPYLGWTSHAGKRHKTHLGAREIYMGLLRFADSPFRIFDALKMSPDYEHWMLLGNMKHQLTTWLCVNLFRLKKQEDSSTLPFCAPISGGDSGWPYGTQEVRNVKSVGDQLEIFTT